MGIEWESVREETVDDAVTGLFGAYEVQATKIADGSASGARHNLASVIGFTSAHMRGSLAIFTSVTLLKATAPGLEDDHAVRDWLAELANQLLGRIKNRMLRYSVTLDMSTPVVVAGDPTIQLHQDSGANASYSYGTEAGSVSISMDVTVDEGFLLADPVEAEADDTMVEGDLMLF